MATNVDAAERELNGSVKAQPPAITDALAHQEQVPDQESEHDADDDTDNQPVDADAAEDDASEPNQPPECSKTPGLRLPLAVGVVACLALGCAGSWFGYSTYQGRQQDALRNQFLAVGKQGALNLTTISYTEADSDVQRVLDSSTGQFHDDFAKRAPAFIDVVKRAQSKTQGTITEAGIESIQGDSARVLVAVVVNTSNAGAADQPRRYWRMRIDVEKVRDIVKVSNVGFVP